jgi:amino acid adenylation domain-containing protein
MVIALLAVIKTGSPYLPIEPAYPELRRAQMLSTAGAALVVTQAELAGRLGDLGARAVCVSRKDSLRPDSSTNPSVPVGPDSPLYVIFTSGSTGTPKGVVNQHGALCNRLQWMQEQFGLCAGERVLQKTPFTFDVSVWEIFWPLRVGATLVLARPDGQRDPVYLAELIERERISTVHFVPSLLQVFLDVPELGRRCASLARIVCSGEELPRALADRCLRALRCSLFNLYGPTEAAIDVSWWECQADHDETTLPIGRPIANTQLYVLDDQKRPVPVGAKGELHIAGRGLAWGYAGRPDLTSERFPELTLPGIGRRRVYCTSDLARFREDGAIEYCGRSDHQIKLRGYRIELGEIECVLRSAPGIKDAVVTVQDAGPSDRRLVAYVVGVEARATVALRRFLRERLPEYMVPARFVSLSALPVGANGKVARAALPVPSFGRASAAQDSAAPSTETENRLAAIVGKLLATERVSVGDNLRDLGFHSLLATSLLKLLQDELGTTLPMKTLFERPTVRELAEQIDRERARDPRTEAERAATRNRERTEPGLELDGVELGACRGQRTDQALRS